MALTKQQHGNQTVRESIEEKVDKLSVNVTEQSQFVNDFGTPLYATRSGSWTIINTGDRNETIIIPYHSKLRRAIIQLLPLFMDAWRHAHQDTLHNTLREEENTENSPLAC